MVGNGLRLYGDAPVWVRLLSRLDVRPVIIGIDRVDHAKDRIAATGTPQDVDDVGADFVADARRVKACRGNGPQQGLKSFAKGRLDHVVEVSRLVGMQLVNAGEVNVQTIKTRRVRSKRLEDR